MNVKFYNDASHTSGVSVYSDNMETASVSLHEIVVGDITYKYSNTTAYDPHPSDGVIYDQSVSGNVTNKTFYILPIMRVVITCYVLENQGNPGTYDVSSTCRLFVGDTEITNGGASFGGVSAERINAKVVFGSAVINGTQYFGIFPGVELYYELLQEEVKYYSGVYVSSNFFQGSLTPAFDGGAQGSSPNGGVGDNDTLHTDPDSIMWAQKFTTGEHGLHVYDLDQSEYSKLVGKLYGLEGAISNFMTKPAENIVSVHVIPYLASTIKTSAHPRIGSSVFQDVDCKEYLKYEYGENSPWVNVGTTNNTFFDWQNTKATLYLPFCGTYPIDIRMIMGGQIKVDYVIDVLQGNCVATVWGKNYEGHATILGTYSGNCAVPIPITGASQNAGIIPGIIETTAGIGAAIMTGGSASVASLGAITKGATNVASEMSSVFASGNLQGNSAAYASTQVLLNIIRPRPIWQSNEAEIIGKPTGKDAKVSDFNNSGFLSGSIHPTGYETSATESEIDAIKSAFESGVYV